MQRTSIHKKLLLAMPPWSCRACSVSNALLGTWCIRHGSVCFNNVVVSQLPQVRFLRLSWTTSCASPHLYEIAIHGASMTRSVSVKVDHCDLECTSINLRIINAREANHAVVSPKPRALEDRNLHTRSISIERVNREVYTLLGGSSDIYQLRHQFERQLQAHLILSKSICLKKNFSMTL
jgi:hypothetical protein